MSAIRARVSGSESIDYEGHRVDVIPSNATRPLLPSPFPHRMTWELRAPHTDELYGYIDARGPDEFCAYDPVAFEFGLGTICRTREEAVTVLLEPVFSARD
jgi:hypothetical protein